MWRVPDPKVSVVHLYFPQPVGRAAPDRVGVTGHELLVGPSCADALLQNIIQMLLGPDHMVYQCGGSQLDSVVYTSAALVRAAGIPR